MSNRHQELRFGLPEDTIEKICTVLAKHQRIEKAVIYGSRAKGNYKPGSDIDLTLYGQNLTLDDLSTVMDELDDRLLPYSIDLSLFDELNNAKLREHIERVGLVFYERGNVGGMMKAGWHTKRLGEICRFVRGPFGGSLKKSVFVDDGFAVYEQQHAIYNQFESVRYFIGDEKFKEMQRFELHPNDLIMSCSGTMGKVAIVPDIIRPGIINQALLKLTPSSSISSGFLKYWMDSTNFQNSLKEQSGGAAIQNVASVSILKEIKILLPPFHEQQRIVSILDEAFKGIATAAVNAKKNLNNACEVFESTLQSVFSNKGEGWIEKSLEELGSITSSKRIYKNEYVKSGIPFYRTKEVKELANGRNITTELFISEARYKEIKTKFGVPQEGDILLTAIGTIGEIYVVHGTNNFYFKDGNVLWLKEFTSINPYFLKYVLMAFVESLNRMAHGAAYSALPIQRLNAHRIFLPPQNEQQAIVAKLDELSTETKKLEAIYQQKLTALDELKKSILNQAFSGQLNIKAAA